MVGGALTIALNQLYVAAVRIAKRVETEQARVVATLAARRTLTEVIGCDAAVTGLAVREGGLEVSGPGGTKASPEVLARFPDSDGARLQVRTARGRDGEPLPGRAMVSVETARGPVATVGLRCGLPEVCEYDTVSGRCREERGS